MNPFVENGCLSPEASLNKLKLVSVGPNNIRGKSALELVSGAFFNEQVDTLFAELGIRAYHSAVSPSAPPGFFPARADKHRRFIECLDDPSTREHSATLLRRLGENLGWILLALKSDDHENRPEWRAEHWDYWRGVDCVYLSGGLSYGILGEYIRQSAEALLARTELRYFPKQRHYPQQRDFPKQRYTLKIADNSEHLPLVGAYQCGAHFAQAADPCMILMDFGHTYVKRAYAANGEIAILDKVESIARYMDDEPEGARAELLNDFIIGVLLDTCAKMERACARPELAAVSIANYVNRGRIYPYRGEYGRLSELAENYEDYLTHVLSARLGRELRVHLVHDGTAAAYGIDVTASDGRTAAQTSAVITLGTGLGVGFCDMRDWDYKIFSIKHV